MTDVDDWDDDYDQALDYWEPDCSCYGRGCPQCGVFSPGLRGARERVGQWLAIRRSEARIRRLRRRHGFGPYNDEAPF